MQIAVTEVGSRLACHAAYPLILERCSWLLSPRFFVDLSAKLEEAIPKLQGHVKADRLATGREGGPSSLNKSGSSGSELTAPPRAALPPGTSVIGRDTIDTGIWTVGIGLFTVPSLPLRAKALENLRFNLDVRVRSRR